MEQKQRASTNKQYAGKWKRWICWNTARGSNPLSVHIPTIVTFLTELFNEGLQVGTIAGYMASLSSTLGKVEGLSIGNHPMVSDLIKGMTNLRPKAYKTPKLWDVDTVLTSKEWGPMTKLDDKQLTWKTAMLLALASGGRCSELVHLDAQHMQRLPEGVSFQLTKHKKNQKSGVFPGTLFL